METEHQIKADLADHADLERVEYRTDGYGNPGRTGLLSMALGIDGDDIYTARTGTYQGYKTYTFVHDGLLWVIKDAFGSCSVCDGLLSAERSDRDSNEAAEHLTKYAKGMLDNAYAFETKNDAVRFVHETDGFGWDRLRNDSISSINEVDY